MSRCAWLRVSVVIVALVSAFPVTGEEQKEPASKGAHRPAASKEAAASAKPAAPTTVAAVDRKPMHVEPAHAPVPMRAKPRAAPPSPHVAMAAPVIMAAAPVNSPVMHGPSAVPAPASHASHWSYEGETGPHAWAKLSPEWTKCGSGNRQSPIDIRDGMKVELDPVVFDYSPSRFRVIDNGHTVQANINGWNSMRVMGRRFKLVQFHFHSPSEEMIDGKLFDMVAHLVHKDSEGRLAVVAVLVERGARQPAIQTVLNNLPLEKGEEYAASTPIDLNQLLPQDKRYFTYMGSLTTPPCSEDVLWIVMKQPVQATADQLNLFARMYPMNARPIQDAGDRVIKESN